ncbi:MAG TPA: transglycosylase domain-containing protein, partial [Anaerolineaceae bacterium]|nr:transglycosylase domain-containing protein [Anaerolineaceae bacterium]
MTDHPENPTTPTEPTEPTKPGERLRRLLASTDETVPAEPGAGQPEAEQSTMAQLADDLLAAAEAEPPADLAEAPTQPLPHHPTGEPDLTGGWYQPGEPVTPPPPPAATLPHPVPPPAAVTRPVTPDPDALTFPPPPGLGDHALPFHVEETDLNATRVTPSAYAPPGARPQHPQPTGMGRPAVPAQPKPAQPKPAQPKPAANGPRKPGGARRALGCAARGLIGLLFLGVSIIVIMGAVAVIQYFVILQNLPSVENLRASASQFETTRILDRNNNVLYEIIDPNAGRRTYVTLDRVSPYLLAATIATEDKEYYNHPGFDILAVMR